MSKLNGHGHGDGDDDRPPNVASLDEARRRAAEKAKAEKRAQSSGGVMRSGPRSARDWLIGGLIVAMAASYIASFFIGTEPVTTGGVQ